MLYFQNDYSEGAHPKVLEALVQSNMDKEAGYGTDSYTSRAKDKIRQACQKQDAAIDFLVGGTQTNAVVINSMLERYQGVIAADTGHINSHEAGAIEFTGHKVLALAHNQGKIPTDSLQDYLENFYADANNEHMVQPGMVYISHPTEYGTLYSKEELQSLSQVCQDFHLPLFLDGARLGYGVVAQESDLDLATISQLVDVFYIGGTKVGALCGEAVVFPDPSNRPAFFTTMIKQQGALLAKGRLLGVQFDALFTDNLYLEISHHALVMAQQIKDSLKEKGYRFYLNSPTNQIFIVIENKQLEKFGQKVVYSFWESFDENHTVIRLATSWATEQADVDKLIELL